VKERWADIKDKAQTDCSMYFLPSGDLEKIKIRAVNEGLWEDLGNGYVTKKPKPKQAGCRSLRVRRNAGRWLHGPHRSALSMPAPKRLVCTTPRTLKSQRQVRSLPMTS
jgi:hypothetical protein